MPETPFPVAAFDYNGLTDREISITLIGKVDTLSAVVGTRVNELVVGHDDHETRIRSITDTLAAQRADLAEIRNEVERRITPAKLWTFVASAVAASAALFDVISHFQK